MDKIAQVIVDIANSEVDRVFDYIALPDTIVGQRVRVPFGRRYIDGYVINISDQSALPPESLKKIHSAIDDYPVLIPELLQLSQYMIQQYHLRFIDCLRLFVPSQLRSKYMQPLYNNYVRVSPDYNMDDYLPHIRANAIKQRDLILFLEPNAEYTLAELNKKFGNNNIHKLLQAGVLTQFKKQVLRKPVVNNIADKLVTLTTPQMEIVNAVTNDETAQTHLVFGVTGSGKTQVYINIISHMLSIGKNAILLVPEISLTPQVMSVFTSRFGDQIALLHSGLSDGERLDEWQRIRLGEVRIVIGARSAIFAPIQNLGVIIMDEEHDASYKSESNPRYLTHDIAKFRAQYHHCPLLLGSATPSIDSFDKAKTGEYILHTLTQRANHSPMPNIQIVNMCDEVKSGNTSIFSNTLLNKINDTLTSGNQVILFLNRRGYSSYVICRECGYVAKCEDCDVSLVYHKHDNMLKCHYCNKRYRALTACPECHSENIRMGSSGTQKIVADLAAIFPDVPIFRLDVDTTKTKNALNTILNDFASSSPAILVGTQMIAKGHDFPNVTLVGILDADMSLHFSDYRAVERTFQLITQVSGRAGRGDRIGEVVLQTYTPNHYIYHFIQDYNYLGFFDRESNLRATTNFPPFAKMIRILITGEDETLTMSTSGQIFEALKPVKLKYNQDFVYLAGMRSPVAKIQNKHRFQILMRFKLDNQDDIIREIYDVVDGYTNPKLQIFVEINPSNMS
ncbi:MAG: primosomal protein N' [Clostridia bacterium]|nr:primosomal protein N' [Clostridia bacterium]